MKKKVLTLVVSFVFLSLLAEKSIRIFTANSTALDIPISNIDSMKINSENTQFSVYKSNNTVISLATSTIDSIVFVDSVTYNTPKIEILSSKYNYTNNKVVCLLNVKSNGGCVLTERGVCWSTSPNPTINDNKFASEAATGLFSATVELTRDVTCYVRAFATNCAGTTYSEQKVLKTYMGNVTYSIGGIDSTANPRPYKLIKAAMDSACYYYNRYTSFSGYIYVYYNTSIPTAQASYHGSIGFGANERYMWVGTALHEMAHFVGSGTTNAWKAKVLNGTWTGTVASQLLKLQTGGILKGDAQHFWPYGINQKEEITGLGNAEAQTIGLAMCAKLTKAMVVDDCGLPVSW